jgi:hypothetical protein
VVGILQAGKPHVDDLDDPLRIDQQGVVKIVDMGLARLQDPDHASKIQNSQLLGTVDYLAPEQALGTSEFDHRADIYSLGCTLYFLLTGRPPFPDGSLHERLMKHQAVDPEPIGKFREDAPEELVAICTKMMAKSPGDRPQSAAEVSTALVQMPIPKRHAKPAAPLKRAQALPDDVAPASAAAALPRIAVGDSDVRVTARVAAARSDKGGSGSAKRQAAAKMKFLATPRQKMIAGSVGGAMLLLLVIVLASTLGSGRKNRDLTKAAPGEGRPGAPAPAPTPAPSQRSDAAPRPAPPTSPEKKSIAFDFETGDLQGWKIIEGKFDYVVSDRATFHDGKDVPYSKQGKFHLSTLDKDKGAGRADEMTGVVDSPVFVLSGRKISMLVGGGSSNDVYVALCTTDGYEVGRTGGNDSEAMRRVEWSVPQLVGKSAFLRIVDRATGAWGHITFDDFRAEGQVDAKATEKLFAQEELRARYLTEEGSTTPGTVAYRTTPGHGNATYDGHLGLDFEVVRPIRITELGVFDSDRDGVQGKLTASVWSRNGDNGGSQLALVEFTPMESGRLEKGTGSRFKPLPEPLVLQPGNYTIIGSRFSETDPYTREDRPDPHHGATDDGGGLVRFVGRPRHGDEGFPNIRENGSVNRWQGGTFKFMAVTDQPPPAEAVASNGANAPASAPALRSPEAAPPAPLEQPTGPSPLQVRGNRLFLNMDDKSGQLVDQSGGDHHGEIRGSVTYDQPGKHDAAVDFSGGGQAVVQGSNVFSHRGDFTWTAWIKTGEEGVVLAFTTDEGNFPAGGKCLFVKDGRLFTHVHGVVEFASNAVVNDGQWHHVALRVKADTNGDRDTVTVFIDGKQDVEKTDCNVGAHGEDGMVLKVGYCAPDFSRSFRGPIDGVTAWDRALEPSEIAEAAEPYAVAFKALGETGNLTPLDRTSTASTHVLGKLLLPPQATVSLDLVGGKKAVRPPRFFSMQPDATKTLWPIFLDTEGKTSPSDRIPIARIALRDQTLYFQWAQGLPPDRANALLNCGLNITVDGKTRFLPLGLPRKLAPAVVNLDAGVARVALDDPSLPPRESLRVKVERIEGGLPVPKLAAGDMVTPGQAVDVTFDMPDYPKFWLRIALDTKVRPVVEVTAMIDYEAPNVAPVPFKAKDADRAMKAFAMENQRLAFELQRTTDNNRKNEINNQTKAIGDKIAKFARLGELYVKLKDDPARVHFRVVAEIAENCRVPVADTAAPEPAAAGAAPEKPAGEAPAGGEPVGAEP